MKYAGPGAARVSIVCYMSKGVNDDFRRFGVATLGIGVGISVATLHFSFFLPLSH